MYNFFDKIIGRNFFLLIVIWILCFPTATYSQETSNTKDGYLECFVSDDYGNPVTGVEISVKNSDFKTESNLEGNFQVEYKIGTVLVLSHPKYLYHEVKIDKGASAKRKFKITLSQKYLKDPSYLDRPYDKVDKNSFLGSAATVYTDQLTSTLASTIIPALAGRMKGLYVGQYRGAEVRHTGRNNASSIGGWIPIFGNSAYSDNSQFSLGGRGSSPVVIVDGVQRELFSLDPESIESVSIQNDALSSMCLGMKSSRGALVITTKSPIKQGFQLSFTAKYGVQSAIQLPDPLSSYQYSYLLNEALGNDGKAPVYSYNDFELYRKGTNQYTHPNVDWFDRTMKKNAPIQSYNLNVSGGGKVAQYYVSLGYFGEEGLFRTNGANSYDTNLSSERYLITSKVNVHITKHLSSDITLMGRIADGNQPGAGYSEILKNVFSTPNNAYPVFNPNGSYGGTTNYTNNLYSMVQNSGYISDNARDVLASIRLKYDFDHLVKGLSVQGMGNITSQSRSSIVRSKRMSVYQLKPSKNDAPDQYDVWGQTQSQVNSFTPVSNYQSVYGQFSVHYDRVFDKHSVSGTLLGDISNTITNYDLPDKPANIMLNASYDYDKRYFVQGAVTRSYYNGYHPGKRWGTFYAAGLGWDISQEEFLSDVKWINQLKLRGVFGQTGNGIDNTGYYTWRQSFGSVSNNVYSQGESRLGGFGLSENSPLANRNLTWEKAYKFNVGVDAALFDNRLQFTADYYNDKYFDLLQQRGKSIEIIGQSYPAENIGRVRSRGLELSITYQNHVGKLNYFITANWSQNQTKLLFIDEQDVQEEYNRITGKPSSVRMGLIADGFFTSVEEIAASPKPAGYDNIRPGDLKYKDLNGDKVIDDFDRTAISGEKPASYFGLNFGFEYHGFDFSMLWQGAYNRDLYLDDGALMAGFQSSGSNYGQAYRNILNRWTPETAATATLPRLTAGGNLYNMMGSSFWVKSGNYIRLKNISVGYMIPESISRNYLGGVKMKVFVNGQNLFTQSACELIDPEVSYTSYPLMRCVNVGINIKF